MQVFASFSMVLDDHYITNYIERETFPWTQEIAAKIILKYIFVSELQSKPEIANLELCTTQSNATGCMIVAGTGINCIIAKADHSP